MRKRVIGSLLICAVTISFLFNGCGSGPVQPLQSSPKVTGVAASGAPISGIVSVKDSSVPAQVKETRTIVNGFYSVDVSGMKPPFLVMVSPNGGAISDNLYSMTEQQGRANVNPFSHATVAAASGEDDPRSLYDHPDPDRYRSTAGNLKSIIKQLQTVLAPLFALYQTSSDPISDNIDADHTGMDALFDDVRIKLSSGMVVVTNKRTGGVIYTAPVKNIASGTFSPENMPGVSGQVNGATLYANNCAGCHGALATGKMGATAAEIQAAIAANTGGMGTLSNLTALQIQAIATALATTVTPPPAACTYIYDAWGACQSNGTQARGVVSSSPAGCTGTPVVSQACTYVPPATTCSSFTYSAWGTCQSNNTQTRTVASSSPSGCTGGTPALSQSCTYVPPVTACTSFTYSAWGTCQSNNTQTRTVATSSPSGCTGGTPVLSQACTYVPPVTTCSSFTYSAWGTCQSDNTQARTVATSSPSGCTGGTPVLSQACTYVPPTPACGSCHTIPPSSGQHTYHVSSAGVSCGTCHGTGYSKTTVNAATHDNGTVDIMTTLNYKSATSSCSPSCHGTRTW